MMKPTDTAAETPPHGDDEAVLTFGDGLENEDEVGPRPADDFARGIAVGFGQSMKAHRTREGLDRAEFGKLIGYSTATVASYEQGRRIPTGPTIDKSDKVLRADGLLSLWKEQMERAQHPAFFQGMAALEKTAIELLMYNAIVVNGLLQTEEYMRALFYMRRPALDPELIEARVAARMARRAIFDRRPAPLLSFIMDESVLMRPYGGKDVLRGQLEHLLLFSQHRSVDIQIMPLDLVESASVDGPFIVATREDGRQFAYAESQGIGSLRTDRKQAALAAARYGSIRSQALPPRESMERIEGVLRSL
ncbi:Scr1 family TA system antitoxin-like transcriptional regulator [Streptomyces sp. NPDC087294]|uniref:Scr1 family TA system antitoxin-like transcriptional regulator n=1 Tax=Streptomyces sp. NPDC087294 TaxID=3365777 RepID=UPI0037F30DA9